MRILILIAFLTLSFTVTAQPVFQTFDLQEAREIAKKEGTFIFVKFVRGRLDSNTLSRSSVGAVWLNDSIRVLQKKFVNTWINTLTPRVEAAHYFIESSTVLILDANGKEYFRKKGWLFLNEAMRLFKALPEDMKAAYAADSLAKAQPYDFAAQLNRAQAYQEAARNADRPIAGQLVDVSKRALKMAYKLLPNSREASAQMKERLKLMKAENLLLSGRAKKALVDVTVLEKKLQESNAALAYYIKGVAYLEMNLPGLAEDYYNKLQEASDNEALLALYREQQ